MGQQVQEQMRQLEKQIQALVTESNARKEKRAQQALTAAPGLGTSGLAMHNSGENELYILKNSGFDYSSIIFGRSGSFWMK